MKNPQNRLFDDPSKPQCHHKNVLIACQHCQILTFLCINYWSEESLPTLNRDVLRLIYEQLAKLYHEEKLKLFRDLANDFRSQCIMQITGTDEIFARSLYINKKRYSLAIAKDELDKLRQKEKQDKVNKKQQTKAQRRQNRHRK